MKKIISLLMVLMLVCTIALSAPVTARADEGNPPPPPPGLPPIAPEDNPSGGNGSTGGGTGSVETGGNTGSGETGGNTGSGETGGNTGSGETGGNTGSGETGGNTGSGETGGNTGSGETGGNTGSGETGGNTGSGETGGNTGSGETGGNTGSGETGGNTGSGETGGTTGGTTGGGTTGGNGGYTGGGTVIVNGIPTVTKHPTSETVQEGGFAEFVSRANDSIQITWYLVGPDGTEIKAETANTRFGSVQVTGIGTVRLGLDRIPKSMNGWRVCAEFTGRDGSVRSDLATLTVMGKALTPPTITENPKDVNVNGSGTAVLKVAASTTESGAELTYQWYRNTTNSNVGGKAILGANAATFTPDVINGTTYYYCAVRTSSGSEISGAAKSTCAAVTFTGVNAQASVTVPTAPAATNPVAPSDETTETTVPQATQPTVNPGRRSNTLLVIVVAAVVAIAVLGIIATLLILHFYPRGEEEITNAYYGSGEDPFELEDDLDEQPAEKEDTWDDLDDLDLDFYLNDDK